MLPVETPFKTYTGLDGKPLDGGYVYFGLPDQNPITAPVTVYWDEAGTLPALQPLRTSNGYILRAGTPANVFCNVAYSELVQDVNHVQVFYAATSNEFSTSAAAAGLMESVLAELATKANAGANTDITSLNGPAIGAATSTTPAAGDNSSKVANTAFCATLVPAGQVSYHAGAVAPLGWLKANGAWVSRTTYANLFAAIGTTHGAGDGSTTFTLPDLRGEFIRSLDDGRGIDAGRVIGLWQADAMQGHKHEMLNDSTNGAGTTNITRTTGNDSADTSSWPTRISNPISDGTNGTPRIAAETRPRNIALLACIKY